MPANDLRKDIKNRLPERIKLGTSPEHMYEGGRFLFALVADRVQFSLAFELF